MLLYALNVEVNKNMEEIITLDGKQFKLTTDRPLTALERQQTISQIRAQTGCSSCRQPKTLSTGGVYSLPIGNSGAGSYNGTGPKGSGSVMTLTAHPNGGVAPYDVRFWKSLTGADLDINQTDITTPTQTGVAENADYTATYTLTDIDVAGALGNIDALSPTAVDPTTGVITTVAGAPAILAVGSVRFYTSIVDSCAGADGRGTCAQYADVALTCVAPTCGFVVT